MCDHFMQCNAALSLQANVLEGKYWKRRQDAVAKEYRKWRVYYHQKIVSAVCNKPCVVLKFLSLNPSLSFSLSLSLSLLMCII